MSEQMIILPFRLVQAMADILKSQLSYQTTAVVLNELATFKAEEPIPGLADITKLDPEKNPSG